MVLVSRTLERIGDHAVDIGEQVSYLLTAEFREFTDASHPEHAPRVLGGRVPSPPFGRIVALRVTGPSTKPESAAGFWEVDLVPDAVTLR